MDKKRSKQKMTLQMAGSWEIHMNRWRLIKACKTENIYIYFSVFP